MLVRLYLTKRLLGFRGINPCKANLVLGFGAIKDGNGVAVVHADNAALKAIRRRAMGS